MVFMASPARPDKAAHTCVWINAPGGKVCVHCGKPKPRAEVKLSPAAKLFQARNR